MFVLQIGGHCPPDGKFIIDTYGLYLDPNYLAAQLRGAGMVVKKDGNFEKHLDFFSSIAQESLKSALKEHFLHQDEFASDDQNVHNLAHACDRVHGV